MHKLDLTVPSAKNAGTSRARKIAGATFITLAGALSSVALFAQNSPALPRDTAAATVPAVPQTSATTNAIYQGVQPCRMIDTRTANGSFGGPKLVANSARTFDLDVNGIAGLCGSAIPVGVKAMVVNVTIVNETSNGFVTIYPSGTTRPTASSINASAANTVIANEIIMPLASGGTIDVYANIGTDLVMDLVGYFTNNIETGTNFFLSGNIGTGTGNGIIEAYNNSTAGNSVGVRGVMLGTSPGGFSAGIRGINNGTGGNGIGVWGSHEGNGYGVYGVSPGGRGVYGTTSTGVGVYGDATNGGFAGFFLGDVTVLGTLSKSAGTFKIDHPADPANKYLSHSFIESPDMMNIYNGNVTTNAKGEAVVDMPEYFSALNKEFRYQLTPVGSFAQAMVAKEIADNKFVIKTNKPNVKISWQVTGIRHDAYADAHRVKVEEEKQGVERGAYLNPEVFGQPAEKGIGYARAHLQQEQEASAQNRGSKAGYLRRRGRSLTRSQSTRKPAAPGAAGFFLA